MANIKIGELREVLKQNKKDNIIEIDYKGLPLEIKTYLPIQEKLSLVASIFESAIDRDNGLHILNGNNLDIAFKVLLVQTYSNLTLPRNIIESYDMLVSSGLYDFIYNNIPESELLDVQMALNNTIDAERDKYEQKNTIQYIVKDLLGGLIDKLPTKEEAEEFITMVSKEISNFDPNKMEFIQEFLKVNRGEK